MTYYVGVDEAGYGPNLGPLIIAATVWNSAKSGPSTPQSEKGYRKYVLPSVDCSLLGAELESKVRIADSKKLFTPGKGLRLIERGVFAALDAAQATNQTSHDLPKNNDQAAPLAFAELIAQLCGPGAVRQQMLPWHDGASLMLPTHRDDVDRATARGSFLQATEAAGVNFVRFLATFVNPLEFNVLCTDLGGKGALLTHRTFALLKRVFESLDADEIRVVCDQHGGRRKYAAVLQHHFPDCRFVSCCESKNGSEYHLRTGARDIHILIRSKAEELLQAALASMAAKYLRELFMMLFNAYWCVKSPGLRPTAGYPVDAKRFWLETAAVRAAEGFADDVLWRRS